MNGVEYEFDEEHLLNSPTLRRLSSLSSAVPINVSSPAEVEEAMAPSFVLMIEAIDNGAIQFANNADEKAFFQIMLITHQLIAQMRPTSATQH